MKVILGIIFAPIVTMAAIRMAIDMSKPGRSGPGRKKWRSWK